METELWPMASLCLVKLHIKHLVENSVLSHQQSIATQIACLHMNLLWLLRLVKDSCNEVTRLQVKFVKRSNDLQQSSAVSYIAEKSYIQRVYLLCSDQAVSALT